MRKRFLTLCLAALMLVPCLVLPLSGCSLVKEGQAGQQTDKPKDQQEDTQMTNSNDVIANIEVKDYGVIRVKLYPEIAPQSVYNFCSLARSGFYDGVTFHRVINNFMIQGGDPTGTGSGGPGYVIKGEFSANGVENNINHVRGVISMARRTKPMDSAGSQFFIVHKDAPHLNGQYAAFGMVFEGMEIVDRIASVPTDGRDKPLEDVVITTITIEGPELPEPEKLPDL